METKTLNLQIEPNKTAQIISSQKPQNIAVKEIILENNCSKNSKFSELLNQIDKAILVKMLGLPSQIEKNLEQIFENIRDKLRINYIQDLLSENYHTLENQDLDKIKSKLISEELKNSIKISSEAQTKLSQLLKEIESTSLKNSQTKTECSIKTLLLSQDLSLVERQLFESLLTRQEELSQATSEILNVLNTIKQNKSEIKEANNTIENLKHKLINHVLKALDQFVKEFNHLESNQIKDLFNKDFNLKIAIFTAEDCNEPILNTALLNKLIRTLEKSLSEVKFSKNESTKDLQPSSSEKTHHIPQSKLEKLLETNSDSKPDKHLANSIYQELEKFISEPTETIKPRINDLLKATQLNAIFQETLNLLSNQSNESSGLEAYPRILLSTLNLGLILKSSEIIKGLGQAISNQLLNQDIFSSISIFLVPILKSLRNDQSFMQEYQALEIDYLINNIENLKLSKNNGKIKGKIEDSLQKILAHSKHREENFSIHSTANTAQSLIEEIYQDLSNKLNQFAENVKLPSHVSIPLRFFEANLRLNIGNYSSDYLVDDYNDSDSGADKAIEKLEKIKCSITLPNIGECGIEINILGEQILVVVSNSMAENFEEAKKILPELTARLENLGYKNPMINLKVSKPEDTCPSWLLEVLGSLENNI